MTTSPDKYSGQHWDGGPSAEVVQARHKAVLRRRCICPKVLKDPTHTKRAGSRTWIDCQRCLGQIKQLT